MNDFDVRIVTLEPFRVACAHGFGANPEGQAWREILDFVEARGLPLETGAVRFFGFNNPDPSPGSPNYGYDQWVTVGPEVAAEGGVELKDFGGGRYAVARCRGVANIGTGWRRLVTWREDSHLQAGNHQWLEECLSVPGTPVDDMVFDLYLPIAE